MTLIDGPTLRALRNSKGVSLRRVALLGHYSHGHLSKLELGYHGRAVTPAVIAAYEKAIGVNLSAEPPGDGRSGWRPGQLSPGGLRQFNGHVAAVSYGAPVDTRPDHLPVSTRLVQFLDAKAAFWDHQEPDEGQVEKLACAVAALVQLDGWLPGLAAREVLRWVVGMLDVDLPDAARSRLYVAVAQLAHRAARSGVDLEIHHSARGLFLVALYAATVADHPDLRARVLADIAAHHQKLDHYRASIDVIRLAESDERVSEPVRVLLRELRARVRSAEKEQAVIVDQAIQAPTGSPSPVPQVG